jgi:2Fe-2S ferredoxin
MGGKNPYLKSQEAELPTQKYVVRYVSAERTIEVDPEKIPYGTTGQPGSLLDIALAHDIEIDHACGGVAACSTCHVIVKKGLESCNEASDEELDMLDMAPAITLQSRLACQCVPNGSQEIEVEIPNWNRNAVREGHS